MKRGNPGVRTSVRIIQFSLRMFSILKTTLIKVRDLQAKTCAPKVVPIS